MENALSGQNNVDLHPAQSTSCPTQDRPQPRRRRRRTLTFHSPPRSKNLQSKANRRPLFLLRNNFSQIVFMLEICTHPSTSVYLDHWFQTRGSDPAQFCSSPGLFEVWEDLPSGFLVSQDRGIKRQASRLRFRAICKQRRTFYIHLLNHLVLTPGTLIHIIMLLVYIYTLSRRPGVGVSRLEFRFHD